MNEDIGRFLTLLWQGRGVREIRVPKYNQYGHTASGYFDNVADAVAAAGAWDGRANVYTTLNEVNPALMARAHRRIDSRASHTTSDADVNDREWLFIDIDAKRPSGISSTAEELAHAERLLGELTRFLAAQGWPEPVTCMSGNGCYALFRIALANDAEATALVNRVLESLAARFDSPGAHVDTAVCNAARLIALVGTKKMKGDSTADRPHRRSLVVSAPDDLREVSRAQLERLCEMESGARRASPGARKGHTGSLRAALDEAGTEYREQPPDANGVTWYHIRQCPFHDDGRPFECGVGQHLPDGAYAGHCFHPEGIGRGWQEFKRALGLDHVGSSRGRHDPAMAFVDERPVIVVSERHRRDIADDAWRALLAANDPVRYFRHGNAAAEIETREGGAAAIRHLGTAGLGGRVDRCADFMKMGKNGPLPARPPRDVIEDMEALDNPLPVLRGIVGTPVFAADGSLDTDTGYQTSTGLYYEPLGEPVPAVPPEPDATDLRAARMLLGEDLLGDFPWADEHASRANLVAALITPMVRELVSGPVPLFGLDAPKAGNGKGLLASCISFVATGHDIAVMADTKSEEEFRKRVTTKLMEGDGVLLFDNVRRRIDSGAFAALLTANVWTDRVLGRSQAVTLPIRSLFLVTGNNLQFSDEITRRVVSVRLDAKTDRPWEGRTFRHPDLADWLRRHRHEVVWAGLVLAQHWIAQGRPSWTGSPMGSYESWCRVLGGILEASGISGFLKNRPDLYRRGDADSEEWRAFTSTWFDAHGGAGVKVADLQSIAEDTLASFFEQMKAGADTKAIRLKLGKAIGERQDTRFEDLFIRRAGSDGHSKTALWCVERAGNEGADGPSPAAHPQESAPVSDTNAGDAGNAGNDSDLPAPRDDCADHSDARAESRNPYPQDPRYPQPDSNKASDPAGKRRGIMHHDDRHPQCKRCRASLASGSSNLCGACRKAALERVMRGQS